MKEPINMSGFKKYIATVALMGASNLFGCACDCSPQVTTSYMPYIMQIPQHFVETSRQLARIQQNATLATAKQAIESAELEKMIQREKLLVSEDAAQAGYAYRISSMGHKNLMIKKTQAESGAAAAELGVMRYQQASTIRSEAEIYNLLDNYGR